MKEKLNQFLNHIIIMGCLLLAVLFYYFSVLHSSKNNIKAQELKSLDAQNLANQHLKDSYKKMLINKMNDKNNLTRALSSTSEFNPQPKDLDFSDIPLENQIWKDSEEMSLNPNRVPQSKNLDYDDVSRGQSEAN